MSAGPDLLGNRRVPQSRPRSAFSAMGKFQAKSLGPYSISIHDIGLGGLLASPAFRRRQEDLGRMATELMALVQDGKITPTVAEQITLEAIPKALERLAEGHVRGKIVARVQS